jgi:DNA replication protein DnaC
MKPTSSPLASNLDYLQLPWMRDNHETRARLASQSSQTHLEFLHGLVDEEVGVRRQRAAKARLAASRMPCVKTLDSWDWKWNVTTIQREQIVPLLSLEILDTHSNLLLFGKQGLGKTHLALAVGHAACVQGVRTLFTTAADMVNRLHAATADRSLHKALRIYTRPTLLIIDEVGYLPFSKDAGDLFFQVITQRYERGSIVLTTNRPFKNWNEIFTDDTAASAIVERLVHHSVILNLRGKSYRLKDKLELANEPRPGA